MADHDQRDGSGLAAMAKCLAWAGVALLVVAVFRQDPAPPAPESAGAIVVRHAAPMQSSRPVSLTIPALGVDAAIERLGVDSHQQLEAPSDPAAAGWYQEGSAPGAAGAAVIAGHVTWDQEPAVFFNLGDLRPGQRVHVRRADGRTAIFAITKIEQYAKDEFPTAQVYRPVERPVLRLITCGGQYDADSDTYTANVVAYGTLVASRG
jgi:sortase (surface protein transpeptidase)